jgi:hypothetical protein
MVVEAVVNVANIASLRVLAFDWPMHPMNEIGIR